MTTVGATEASSELGFEEEVAASYSSGGFSNYFSTPQWQEEVVNQYIAQPDVQQVSAYFNSSGRAFPDVSAYGTNYGIYWRGERSKVLGTSASAPTFAAAIAQANLARSAAGKGTLGQASCFSNEDALAECCPQVPEPSDLQHVRFLSLDVLRDSFPTVQQVTHIDERCHKWQQFWMPNSGLY